MLAAIAPFLYCLLLGSAWGVAFKKKFADSLAPAFMLHIIIVMLAGMTLHKLSVGIWGGVLLFAGVLAYKIMKQPQEARVFLRSAWRGGLFIFIVFYAFCFFVNNGRRFIDYDTYAHWGLFIKESLRLDRLYAESLFPIVHKDYVPAITLFEVIWCRSAGRFLEADVFRALQIFGFSLLLPLFSLYDDDVGERSEKLEKRPFSWGLQQLFLAFLLVFVLMAVFNVGITSNRWEHGYYNVIKIDITLGFLFFYCFWQVFSGDREWYQTLLLTLGLATLVLSKQNAIALHPMIVLLHVARNAMQSGWRFDKTRSLRVVLVLAAPVVLWLAFNIFVAGTGAGVYKNQSYASVEWSGLLSVFDDPEASLIKHLGEMRGKFIEAVFKMDIIVCGSYAVIVALTSSIVFAMAFFCKNEKMRKEELVLAGVFIILSGVAYALIQYMVYAVAFPANRAVILGSYDRYMQTFAMSAVLVMIYCFMRHGYMGKRMLAIVLLSLLSFFYRSAGWEWITDFWRTNILLGLSGESARLVDLIEKRALQVSALVPEGGRIYVMSINNAGNKRYVAFKFYSHPKQVYNINDNMGGVTPDDEAGCRNIHCYLYVDTLDEKTFARHKGKFVNPKVINVGTLYKLIPEAKGLRLEAVAVLGSLKSSW